jgi:hypothetical protein
VHLSVGCEFVLFVPGIVPGDSAVERIKNLTSGNFDPQKMIRRLSAFTAQAAKVDWDLFDLVSVNDGPVRGAHLHLRHPPSQGSAHDLDLASHAIVKPVWKTRDEPAAHWHWEPREAFHALAGRFA